MKHPALCLDHELSISDSDLLMLFFLTDFTCDLGPSMNCYWVRLNAVKVLRLKTIRCHHRFRAEQSESKKDVTMNKLGSKFKAGRLESPCLFHFNDSWLLSLQ